MAHHGAAEAAALSAVANTPEQEQEELAWVSRTLARTNQEIEARCKAANLNGSSDLYANVVLMVRARLLAQLLRNYREAATHD